MKAEHQVGAWNLVREKRGWIYRHSTGAGATGHHRNPHRAFLVLTSLLQERWHRARARFVATAP